MSCATEDEPPVHFLQPSQLDLAQRHGLLQPPEALLDQSAATQAEGTAGLACCSTIQVTAPPWTGRWFRCGPRRRISAPRMDPITATKPQNAAAAVPISTSSQKSTPTRPRSQLAVGRHATIVSNWHCMQTAVHIDDYEPALISATSFFEGSPSTAEATHPFAIPRNRAHQRARFSCTRKNSATPAQDRATTSIK